MACFSKGSTNIKDVGDVTLNQVWGGGGKEVQFKWEHLGDAWPLIKYASRLVYIMSLIICMIVVRKCNKMFFTFKLFGWVFCLSNCFGWSSVCFGTIETSKHSVSV